MPGSYPITPDQARYAILNYFNPSSDIWQKVNNGLANEQEILNAYSYIPQMKKVGSIDGTTILGYDYADDILAKMTVVEDDIVGSVNSNYTNNGFGSGSNGFKADIPSNWSKDNGKYLTQGGGTVTNTGASLAMVADTVNLAVAGVNLGAKLGMWIDEGLYNLAPNFWNENFPTIDPRTWSSLCGQSPVGDYFMRVLFGITEQGQTAYMQSEGLAYTYQMMRDLGFFNIASSGVNISPTVQNATRAKNYPTPLAFTDVANFANTLRLTGSRWFFSRPLTGTYTLVSYKDSSGNIRVLAVSNAPFSIEEVYADNGARHSTLLGSAVTHNHITYYTVEVARLINSNYGTTWKGYRPDANTLANYDQSGINWDTSYLVYNGDRYETTPIPGTGKMEDATIPDPSIITGTTTEEVLQQLKQNYPQLFNDSITSSVLQDDGTIKDFEYVPVPWTNESDLNKTNPITGDKTQEDTQIDDETFTEIVTRDPTTNPPDTGEGEGSPYVTPTGNASSLWAVYHPSQSQLNAFGAWLWSSDFVEQIKRLFNDPMQAIIGVHKVFAPIPTGGSQTIKCGYLDSGVSSPTVSSQYTEVDCGTVDCREYFGNVFDYDPHTKVSIYLPFIGVVPLKVSEVMRASINVTYGVDVITGACLAKVKVTRDGGGGILYSYGGSCACHYPISSGSYAGIISGIVTSAIGIAGGIVTGNPLSAIGGAMAGLHQAHTEVQRSGGFTGSAGAMGPKIPYLIIDRPQTRLAADFEAYQGKPANSAQFIGDCVGFVRATEVHFSAPGVFDEEAREVESLLKAGVKLD